jgi:phosphatidylserine/phosphatidylglycerophosphate/cardiolipin synthase-like enzyme
MQPPDRKSHDKYRFPWRSGHRFQLLVDGREFYTAMLNRIALAERYVLLEMYLFESGRIADRFIDALIEAGQRGVQVYLLLDAFGSLWLRKQDRQRLVEASIQLCFYNPLKTLRMHRNLFRNHRKLLVVDGLVAYSGGAGITDAFDPAEAPNGFWHEAMIEVSGPNVADWEVLFSESWQRWADTPLEIAAPAETPLFAGGPAGRVVVHGHAMRPSEIVRSYVNYIRRAKERVWLATAYFVPPWKLRRALRYSARHGTDVRLMLPGPHTDVPGVRHMSSRYYERLMRNGIRVFEYQPRFLHAKVLLCDDWLSIGSCNADRWNYRWNLEANQEVKDPVLISKMARLFEADFAHCEEFDYELWRRRPWYQKLREDLWGQVVNLLQWFSSLKRHHRGPDD